MALKNVFRNWRERMGERSQARSRRSEVEKDGIFYCQFCKKRNAQLGSGLVADDAAYCSKSCGELLARQMFNRDVRRGGGEVVSIGSGNLDSFGSGFFEKKYCKWCGERLYLGDRKCPMCGGIQERRRSDML